MEAKRRRIPRAEPLVSRTLISNLCESPRRDSVYHVPDLGPDFKSSRNNAKFLANTTATVIINRQDQWPIENNSEGDRLIVKFLAWRSRIRWMLEKKSNKIYYLFCFQRRCIFNYFPRKSDLPFQWKIASRGEQLRSDNLFLPKSIIQQQHAIFLPRRIRKDTSILR